MPESLSKSSKFMLRIINKLKEDLKNNDVFKEMCKEYDLSVDVIDLVPVKFGDLDVSARTESGVITLNKKLLESSKKEILSYLVHETKHHIDSCYGDRPTIGANDCDYLRNPDEAKAFKFQIDFLDDQFGYDRAEDYTEHLLDHHDKSGKEREHLKDKLMERVDEK